MNNDQIRTDSRKRIISSAREEYLEYLKSFLECSFQISDLLECRVPDSSALASLQGKIVGIVSDITNLRAATIIGVEDDVVAISRPWAYHQKPEKVQRKLDPPPMWIMPDFSGGYPPSWGSLIWNWNFPDSSYISGIGTFTNAPWYWIIAWSDGTMTYNTDHNYGGGGPGGPVP